MLIFNQSLVPGRLRNRGASSMSNEYHLPPAMSVYPRKRDFELCKVVFVAAISQILYARRAFPPECFQLLPLQAVVSQPFEAIVAAEYGIRVHDKELLRDQAATVFLRQGKDYGVNRFLGILREDIFPLIENEGLIKFRVNYLRARAWSENALAEYYTVSFKYENNGSYGLDIWRAGMGKHHVSTTDSQLWNLGDYLSRLPSWTEPVHWTLAFHSTERPDDPPIGVWKFDRTEFDDANFRLQQQSEYSYAMVSRLEIMALSPVEAEEVIFETSSDPEREDVASRSPEPELKTAPRSRSQRKRRNTSKPEPRNITKPSASRRRGATAIQPSPPPTLASSRNTSKNTISGERDGMGVAVESPANGVTDVAEVAEGVRNSGTKKAPVAKRKPKRPLQLFETAASSLPPTQIIGESQSWSQKPNYERTEHSAVQPIDPRSPSPDPFALLDGISLSSEAISGLHTSPSLGLPQLPASFPDTRGQWISGNNFRGLLRLGPSSSVVGAPSGMTQWEPRASPPANILGITLSDEVERVETASEADAEAEEATLPRPPIDGNGDAGISYSFSPNTVARWDSLFQDIPSSSIGSPSGE